MMSQATVYLIRHGEKPPTGDNLSVQGVERSQALPQVFGQDSQYNIGHIMAERPKASKLIIICPDSALGLDFLALPVHRDGS